MHLILTVLDQSPSACMLNRQERLNLNIRWFYTPLLQEPILSSRGPQVSLVGRYWPLWYPTRLNYKEASRSHSVDLSCRIWWTLPENYRWNLCGKCHEISPVDSKNYKNNDDGDDDDNNNNNNNNNNNDYDNTATTTTTNNNSSNFIHHKQPLITLTWQCTALTY